MSAIQFYIITFFIFPFLFSYANTLNLVPNENGGSVGTLSKNWNASYFNNLVINGVNVSESLIKRDYAVTSLDSDGQLFTNHISLLGENGVFVSKKNNNTFEIGLFPLYTEYSSDIGPNRVYFSNLNSDQNYSRVWQSPKTGKIGVWMWGGAGGGLNQHGGYGGFTYATINVTAGEWFTIVVGGGGRTTRNQYGNTTQGLIIGDGETALQAPGGWPNGGTGATDAPVDQPAGGGGGRSQLLNGYFTDITNIQETLIIAGGGGGIGYRSSADPRVYIRYSSGGGIRGDDGNLIARGGEGGTQSNGGYINGGLLKGGDYTPASAGNDSDRGRGGGGDGYYGGGSLTYFPSSGGSGGGGSGYVAETNKIVFGITLKTTLENEVNINEYIIGHGDVNYFNASDTSAGGGLVVIGY